MMLSEWIWAGYFLGAMAFPNQCDPIDNETISFGHNVGSNSAPLDPSRPAIMATFESWYEPTCGGDHLQEWHIQWRWNGVPLRPISLQVNPEQASAAVGFQADFFAIRDDHGATRVQVSNNTMWTHVPVTRVQSDAPIVAGLNSTGTAYREVARITGDDVEIGRGASGIRFGASRPTVTTCAELGEALDDMGLVNWAPAP